MERRNFFKTAAALSAIPLFPALAFGSASNGAGMKNTISIIEFWELSCERKASEGFVGWIQSNPAQACIVGDLHLTTLIK